MIAALSNSNLAYVRLGLRALQFICSLFAMSFAAAGFYDGGATHSSTFVLLMGYTGWLYALWYIVCVDLFHLVSRPALRLEQATDLALAIALLVSGICLATVDYVKHCSDYNDAFTKTIHCHNLKAAVAFDFIAMFFFLATLALTFVAPYETHAPHNVQVEEPVPYHQEATPTGALSPIGHQDGPGSKV